MKNVGFIGWRGMVGSVLINRMMQENDFKDFNSIFFSTSQMGAENVVPGVSAPPVMDAYDLKKLTQMDILISCQGGDYTTQIYPQLRSKGWQGYWIDAASTLRMQDDSVIALDPVNKNVIENALLSGIKNYIGGNCTVSLMLMALAGLVQNNLVEWISSMTYQAASGAGAKYLLELMQQVSYLGNVCQDSLQNPKLNILDFEKTVTASLFDSQFPTEQITAPLIANLLPWIDTEVENGQSREEWKGMAETNKILEQKHPIPVDGICVRVPSMRCHSQALTIKLKKNLTISEIETLIASANPWVKVVPNQKQVTLKELTPAAISGTLAIAVGRIKKLKMGEEYLSLFTVGDQLLWGAAEPLRRVLRLILQFNAK